MAGLAAPQRPEQADLTQYGYDPGSTGQVPVVPAQQVDTYAQQQPYPQDPSAPGYGYEQQEYPADQGYPQQQEYVAQAGYADPYGGQQPYPQDPSAPGYGYEQQGYGQQQYPPQPQYQQQEGYAPSPRRSTRPASSTPA